MEEYTLKRLLVLFLACATALALQSGAAFADSTLTQFNGAKLEVNQEDLNAKVTVRLNGRDVLTVDEALSLSVVAVAEASSLPVFVLFSNSGGTACPGMFYIVAVQPDERGFPSKDKAPAVSKPFGTCTDFFAVSFGSRFTITIPSFSTGKAVTATIARGVISIR